MSSSMLSYTDDKPPQQDAARRKWRLLCDTRNDGNNNNNNLRLFDWWQTAQLISNSATHVGKQQKLYTEGLSTAKLLPQTAHSDWINRTGLTSSAFTRWCDRHTSDKVAHYSIYRPRKDERLSWPSWLTYSGRLTHISGHPSAAGRAWDRESSPVKDQRSNQCATEPSRR